MRTAQKLQEKQQEKQKSSELAFAAPRLVPSPRYFANFNPLLS